jgi:hypothetical protein
LRADERAYPEILGILFNQPPESSTRTLKRPRLLIVTKTILFKIPDQAGIRQYLDSSTAYLNGNRYSRMNYPFPDLKEKCLLGGYRCGARWKGYYTREVICSEVAYEGAVAIHVFHCKRERRDVSYFPDF